MNAKIKVLGIYREEKFSNRAIEADKDILDEVLQSILYLHNGATITKIRPEDIGHKVLEFNYDLVFSMAQEENILSYLELLEKRGTVVVNSAKAVRNCYRGKLSELLMLKKISYPKFMSLNVDQNDFLPFDSSLGYWVKRGDFHAVVDEDVVYIKNIQEIRPVLENFRDRGVNEVILQEGLVGELFKFYGVRNVFFNLRHMGRTTSDRYNYLPGNPNIRIDRNHLENLVHKTAAALELDYFGGDIIVSDNGDIHFIDFNDWPSFRTCKKIVAPKMAQYALLKLKSEALIDTSYVQGI